MIIVGIDEVGRGCWAGPVVAGAVILKQPIAGLTDSKLLSKKKRELLAQQIRDQAIAVGLGWVEAAMIDEIGINPAVQLAMASALGQVKAAYDQIIIDGQINFLPDNPKARAIIKADLSEPAVSAASIVAKVARDAYMAEQAKLFPNHGFDKHVGYGTALHMAMLKQYGVTALHRKSYKPIQGLIGATV